MTDLPTPMMTAAQCVSMLAFADPDKARTLAADIPDGLDPWTILGGAEQQWDEASRRFVDLSIERDWRLSGRRAGKVGAAMGHDREEIPLSFLAGLPRVHVQNWLYNDADLEAGCFGDVKLPTAEFAPVVATDDVGRLVAWARGRTVLPSMSVVQAFAKRELGRSRAWVRGNFPEELRRPRGATRMQAVE